MRFLLLINIFLSSYAYSMFQSSECINNDFETSVSRKGAAFGLMKYQFNISKKRCVINLKYKDVLKSEWTFDICREPIHLKVHQYFSEKVYIKQGDCFDNSKKTFCRKTKEFLELIQKEGLINAKGERNSLETEHGKVYCGYKLLKKHLEDGSIFIMNGTSNPSLFETADLLDVLPKKETIEKKVEVVKEAIVKKTEEITDKIKNNVSNGLEEVGKTLEETGENIKKGIKEAREELDSF